MEFTGFLVKNLNGLKYKVETYVDDFIKEKVNSESPILHILLKK
jgi:hypothetical protein